MKSVPGQLTDSARRRRKPTFMHLTRRATALAAAALITASLSACGADEPEQPTSGSRTQATGDAQTTSGASSMGTSHSPNSGMVDPPDDLPVEALKETKGGAAAFGRYYYEALGEAGLTGDTRVLKSLGAEDCKVCSTAIKGIEDERAKGWSRNKNPYSITGVEMVKRTEADGYKVSMTVDVAAHQRRDRRGKVNGTVDATNYTLTVHVVWHDGRWQMADWVVT